MGILINILCAFMGTIGYAILFNVPKRFYLCCGMTGAAGWLMYLIAHEYSSPAVASFLKWKFACRDFR